MLKTRNSTGGRAKPCVPFQTIAVRCKYQNLPFDGRLEVPWSWAGTQLLRTMQIDQRWPSSRGYCVGFHTKIMNHRTPWVLPHTGPQCQIIWWESGWKNTGSWTVGFEKLPSMFLYYLNTSGYWETYEEYLKFIPWAHYYISWYHITCLVYKPQDLRRFNYRRASAVFKKECSFRIIHTLGWRKLPKP